MKVKRREPLDARVFRSRGRTAHGRPTRDKSFKNAALDYPLETLRFVASTECGDLTRDAVITPLRQEQLSESLDWPFRETDVPFQVVRPDGERKILVVIFEEETDPKNFDIVRLAQYTLGGVQLLGTRRIVPAVLFVKAGRAEEKLEVGTERWTWLKFEYERRQLASLRSRDHWDTTNPFVCLNLVNMRHRPSEHLDVCKHTIDRFFELEPDARRRGKYFRFVELEARLSKRKRVQLRTWAATESRWRTNVKTLFDEEFEKGWNKGVVSGKAKWLAKGEANALLIVLAGRGLRLSRLQRERITRCRDATKVKTWLRRAVTAKSVSDVFRSTRSVH